MNKDVKRWILIWIILLIVGYFTMHFFYPLKWPIQLLITTNVVTFVLMLLDKIAASIRMRRIPEKVLYLVTLLGGSIGMLIGMFLIRHKSRKVSFQFVVGVLVMVQIVFVVWYLNEFEIPLLSS